MAARVVVVAGPAASGKTRQLLQAHRAALASRQPGVALWLAYGIGIGAWPVIISNAITLALALFILALKLRFG